MHACHRKRWRFRISLVAVGVALFLAVSSATAQDPLLQKQPPPAAQKPAKTTGGSAWVSFALVGIAVALGVAASLMFLGSKKRTAPRSPSKNTRRTANVIASPPDQTPSGADPTAICDKTRKYADSGALLSPDNPEIAPPDPNLHTAISASLPKAPLPPLAPRAPLAPLADYGLTLPASSGPLSRGASIACGRCKRPVPAELGIPPWCPHCGRDLKNAAEGSSLVFGGGPVTDVDNLGAARQLQPPYFVARLGRTYRVYILPSKLLFLDAPAIDDVSGAERIIRGVSIQGGLIGWIVGSAVTGNIADDRRSKARNRHLMLDVAEVPALVEMADHESTSFRVDVDDLGAVRIEGLSFWQNAFADRCAGRLHFVHPDRGPVSVDLPKPDDVRVAIKQLAAVLGDKLTVNAAWDWGKERFVPKS